MFQGGLFVFELQVDRQDKMDVLFVTGVYAAAGNFIKEKLIGRKTEFFQQKGLE